MNENVGRIRGVYAIIDLAALKGRSARAAAESVLAAGITVVQLRAKRLPAGETHDLARAIAQSCAAAGALFIVNDRLDLAIAAGAGGVHLGQDDLPIAAARKIAGPHFVIGVSTHSLAEARAAAEDGADYLGFGAMYLTGTKSDVTRPQGPARLREVVQAVRIPVVAIGGVGLEQLGEVKAAGAAAAAVISAICSQPDPGEAARRLVENWRI